VTGCVVILAIVILGVVLRVIWKMGSFTIVDVTVRGGDPNTYYFSRQKRLQKLALPTRLLVRCDQCKTEWEPTIVPDVSQWKERPADFEDEQPSAAPFALFKPSISVVGHAGPQPTEPAFKLVCPSCFYKGDVSLQAIHSFAKKRAKK
jgi:hypothetical protein